MEKINVLGMGPGHRDYVLPISTSLIEESDVIVSSARLLQGLELESKEVYRIGSLTEAIEYIKGKRHKQIAVLVSGDSCFFSMLSLLRRHFESEELNVVPGISSLQYMFSRLGMSWSEAFMGSVHGRELDFAELALRYKAVGLLTDGKWNPQAIAKALVEKGLGEMIIYIGENLSYENERISRVRAHEAALSGSHDMCVVVICDE